METPVVRVGIIGAGTVGAALIDLLSDTSRVDALIDAAGSRLELVAVAVRDTTRVRSHIPAHLLVDSAEKIASDPTIDVVVELMGGTSVAHELITTALQRGASVVTANKALLALSGTALSALARDNATDLFYEGAVGGGIPILRALRTSLAGERINRVMGIVNGTTNFILSKMTSEGSEYASVLSEAQSLGYAESDPTADVEGFDAAAKVTILSSLAFGTALDGSAIYREGITKIRVADVEFATRNGYVIKLLGISERVGASAISQRVHPAMVAKGHPLASVAGAFNAVFVEGASSGPLMWLGQGAGGAPTAAAVLGDVVAAARNKVTRRFDVPFSVDTTLGTFPMGELQSAFYITLNVIDRPGVLSAVTSVFGDHDVSIRSMEQSGFGDEAHLMFVTHIAFESDVSATLIDLAKLEVVEEIGSCIRLIGVDG
jgi:homoserine dehydrogenase